MPEEPRTFRIEQLGPPRGPQGRQTNEPVSDLDSLVTHHPRGNRDARMRDGSIQDTEDLQPGYRGGDRSYAYIDGEFQEIIDRSTDRYGSLRPDQVLMVKDFILEDPAPARGVSDRAVSVPSPTAGYISRIRDTGGMVEIMDRQGGEVIARVRHLDPISVREGDTIEYGQSLGTQSNRGLPRSAGVHVHIEMDSGHRQALENYIDDLHSGRLPVQAELRPDTARAAVDDGTFRIGQSSGRIRDLQRVMAAEGYHAVGNAPLDQDGVYRPTMQGTLLDFQRAHGLPQTGNIDPATLRMAPVPQHAPVGNAIPSTAPGHPDHPDHRPLPPAMQPAVNQHAGPQAAVDPRGGAHLGQLSPSNRAMFAKIRSDVSAQISDDVVASALLAAKQAGIDSADRIRATAVAGDRLFVAGITPGYHAVVDVSQPAPPAQETLQQVAQHDKQQALAPQEPQMEQQRNGPTLKT